MGGALPCSNLTKVMARLSGSGWGLCQQSLCCVGRRLPAADVCRGLRPQLEHSCLLGLPRHHPFTSKGAWSSMHLGLLWRGLLGPSTTGGHCPPDTSLGVFLYLPVGMPTGLQSGLLGKDGINSSHFGLGVPTCHGKSTGTHAAVSQPRHLEVGENMYTVSRF